jgi:hypothetical protein
MKQSNQEELTRRHPVLYRGIHLSVKENLMPFGFECGDGWFGILRDLGDELLKVCPDAMAMQVKEKYGTLCFYAAHCNDEGYEAIDRAEKLSMKTCENCGREGTTKGSVGWVLTLCVRCRENRNNARQIVPATKKHEDDSTD